MKKLLFVAALAACGGGHKPAPAEPTATPAAAPAPTGPWELGELKFYQGDELGMQLHANGHLEVKLVHGEPGKPPEERWQDVGAVSPDGTVTAIDGKKHAEIKPDGSVVTQDGGTAPFHLEGETLVVADKKITIDDKGILQGGNDMGKPMRIEGATTPGLKRTALVVLALIMSAGEREPATTPPTATSPAPVPAPK
ncbi:MAG TPA: hypothetical protein VLT45_06435 [Kofleriaceae bacterium]|nr:hypothetical protein [Kofleriaceae bacterium]